MSSDTKTTALLFFDGTEATDEMQADIAEIQYIDNDDEHADDLQIMTYTENVFSNVTKIALKLTTENWHGNNVSKTANCGTFEIDDKESCFISDLHLTRAAAITSYSRIRQTPRNQAWERFNLKEIAEEIARRNNVNIIYAADYIPIYTRKEQLETSDIKFLSDLCHTSGLRLKFTTNSLVIYSPYENEKNAPVKTFTKGDIDILDDKLHHKKNDTDYAQCRVSYKDPVTKQLISYTYKLKDNGRRLDIKQKVTSTEEAKALAMYSIKEKNKREYTGYIVCDGDISLATGCTIKLNGYGEYDRKYMITKAIHRLSRGIYTTKIYFETVLEGY